VYLSKQLSVQGYRSRGRFASRVPNLCTNWKTVATVILRWLCLLKGRGPRQSTWHALGFHFLSCRILQWYYWNRLQFITTLISGLSFFRGFSEEPYLLYTWGIECYKAINPDRFAMRCKSYPCGRPWRPIVLWDVKAPTFSRQSAHRWWWSCQPYASAALYPQKDSWHSLLLKAESTPGPLSG
jgi:hypothetical protein